MGNRRMLKRERETKAFWASSFPPVKTYETNVASVICGMIFLLKFNFFLFLIVYYVLICIFITLVIQFNVILIAIIFDSLLIFTLFFLFICSVCTS